MRDGEAETESRVITTISELRCTMHAKLALDEGKVKENKERTTRYKNVIRRKNGYEQITKR